VWDFDDPRSPGLSALWIMEMMKKSPAEREVQPVLSPRAR
jgi:hypothetical protein